MMMKQSFCVLVLGSEQYCLFHIYEEPWRLDDKSRQLYQGLHKDKDTCMSRRNSWTGCMQDLVSYFHVLEFLL